MTTFGVALLSTGITTALTGETVGDLSIVIPALTLLAGSGAVSSGGLFLHMGVKRRRTYREWEAAQPREQVPEVVAADLLHHVIEPLLLRAPDVVDRNDGRVLELGDDLSLGEEPGVADRS